MKIIENLTLGVAGHALAFLKHVHCTSKTKQDGGILIAGSFSAVQK